jgi:hypothetical protein
MKSWWAVMCALLFFSCGDRPINQGGRLSVSPSGTGVTEPEPAAAPSPEAWFQAGRKTLWRPDEGGVNQPYEGPFGITRLSREWEEATHHPCILVIPREIGGERVEALYGLWPEWREEVFSLVIPDTVLMIADEFLTGKVDRFDVDPGNPVFSSRDGVLFSKDFTRLIRYPNKKEDEIYEVPGGVEIIGYTKGAANYCKAFGGDVRDATSNSFLRRLVIPESVKEIDSFTFYGCTGLTGLRILGPVETIKENTFWNCRSLASVELPRELSVIENEAFKGCRSLVSIELPQGLSVIKTEAFADCSSLSSVSIPGSITSIDSAAFINTRVPFEAYAMGVTRLSQYADGVFKRYTDLEIPATVREIDPLLFKKLPVLRSLRAAPGHSVYAAGDGVLFSKDMSALLWYPAGKEEVSYTVPGQVTVIGKDAFSSNRQLRSVSLPPNIQSLGSNAFAGCSGLTAMHFPASLESAGYASPWPYEFEDYDRWAFAGCENLAAYTVDPENPVYFERDGVLFARRDGELALVRYPPAKTERHYEVPPDVTVIASAAAGNNPHLESVFLPPAVKAIGIGAFGGEKFRAAIVYTPEPPDMARNRAYEDHQLYLTGSFGGYWYYEERELRLYVPEACLDRYLADHSSHERGYPRWGELRDFLTGIRPGQTIEVNGRTIQTPLQN